MDDAIDTLIRLRHYYETFNKESAARRPRQRQGSLIDFSAEIYALGEAIESLKAHGVPSRAKFEARMAEISAMGPEHALKLSRTPS